MCFGVKVTDNGRAGHMLKPFNKNKQKTPVYQVKQETQISIKLAGFWSNRPVNKILLKGTVHPKIPIFPLTCSAIY